MQNIFYLKYQYFDNSMSLSCIKGYNKITDII